MRNETHPTLNLTSLPRMNLIFDMMNMTLVIKLKEFTYMLFYLISNILYFNLYWENWTNVQILMCCTK